MRAGTVYLVGAGPGDPGLLTARALELLRGADVVLHDQLIPFEALDVVREDAIVVDVGKIGGGRQVPQRDTNALLVEHARAGRSVVRLKGGDPFVFGRGGEEVQLLHAEGIPVEVVPGITAGIAAAAYAGVPVTQRGMASAVAFVTGHEDPSKPESSVDWPALAAFPGTLVFYMGMRSLARIAQRLVEEGRPADEPVAVVERGTMAGQRVVSGTLADIAGACRGGRRRRAGGHGRGAGRRAARRAGVARAAPARRAAGSSSRAHARRRAASPRRSPSWAPSSRRRPAIAIEPVAVDLPDLGSYDLVCLTSVNGVERLFELVRDARALAGPTIAAIGPGTAERLRAHGVVADVVPERARSARDCSRPSPALDVRRALVLRAREGRDVLPDGLRERGVEVDSSRSTRRAPSRWTPTPAPRCSDADWITFTAGSAVRSLVSAVGGADALRGGPRLASIGPATSGGAARAGPRAGSRGRRAHARRPGRRARRLAGVGRLALLGMPGIAPGPFSGLVVGEGSARRAARARARRRAARWGLDRHPCARGTCVPRYPLVVWATPMSLTITFLTDYGLQDEFVGVCHGVIAGIAPDAKRHRPHARRPAP